MSASAYITFDVANDISTGKSLGYARYRVGTEEDPNAIIKVGEVETHALNGVTMEIEEGEFAALVGPSGSGKTTMLQLMGCTTVLYEGKPIGTPDPGAFWRVVSQHA